MPWPALELVEQDLAQDGDAVGPVQGDGAKVEDGRDGDVAAEADEVDEDADERIQPHGQDGGVGAAPDLVPHARPGQHLVAREGPDGAAAGLQGRDADKVHDDEGGHGEEDGGLLAHHVVVDLHDGLLDGRGQDVLGRVVRGQVQGAHAEGQDDGEEPSDHVGEAQGRGYGSWDRDCRVLCFFGDAAVMC